MKKLFTMMFALGLTGAVFAQTGHRSDDRNEARSVVLGPGNGHGVSDSRYGSSTANDVRNRDLQIQRINREFDQKIRDVQWNRRLRSSEKNRQVRLLEKQRQEQIRMVNEQFAQRNGRYGRY